ncbi:hypothetical protein FQN54_008343 [Arachnomyces sp. PD_36]|nr:hypothetical protein FQN54_008343 [Arachnomyces sp. PD_36]
MCGNRNPHTTSLAPLWTPITPSTTSNLLPPIITSNFTGVDQMRTPSNSSSPWSGQDDEVLTSARSQSLGWAQIQKDHFPTKTPNACRKRYERLVAKKRSHDWDQERIERLAAHYLDLREQIWKPLAQVVGESWEEVEKKCLERGLKNLRTMGQMSRNRGGGSEGTDSHESYNDHDENTYNDSPADSSTADDVKSNSPAESRKSAMLGWKELLVS